MIDLADSIDIIDESEKAHKVCFKFKSIEPYVSKYILKYALERNEIDSVDIFEWFPKSYTQIEGDDILIPTWLRRRKENSLAELTIRKIYFYITDGTSLKKIPIGLYDLELLPGEKFILRPEDEGPIELIDTMDREVIRVIARVFPTYRDNPGYSKEQFKEDIYSLIEGNDYRSHHISIAKYVFGEEESSYFDKFEEAVIFKEKLKNAFEYVLNNNTSS